MPKKGKLYIGTSNITLPGNKLSFPVEYHQQTRLTYYASLFNSLEVNSSFYKVPLARTFTRWASEVSSGFRFSIKLWKGITHVKELRYDPADISRFMQAAEGIGDRKGNILVQFPKSITADRFDEVSGIIEAVRQHDPENTWGIGVEFRHESWFNPKSYYGKAILEVLNRVNGGLVIHDMPGCPLREPSRKSRAVFLRFHGETGNYRGSYPDSILREKAESIRTWISKGRDVYAYFNNTIGDAFNNARTLARMVNDE